MIMIYGQKTGVTFEQLFEKFDDKAQDAMERIEIEGFEVRVIMLPKTIRSFEDYGMHCLERFEAMFERYDPKFH